jgi:hypothetical protein
MRTQMGAAGRQRVDDLFSIDTNVRRLSEVFERARAA